MQLTLRTNPGPIARILGPARRQSCESKTTIGIRQDLGVFGHQMMRLDDIAVFGLPLPYHIAALLSPARFSGEGKEYLAGKKRAIAGLKAAEIYYKAFRTTSFINWLPVTKGGQVQFEIMQAPVFLGLAEAILTFLHHGRQQHLDVGELGVVGLTPMVIDKMIAMLNNQGFELSLPTSEQLDLLSENHFLWHNMMELTATVEDGKRIARRLVKPGRTLSVEEKRLVLPSRRMLDVTFRLVRPYLLD